MTSSLLLVSHPLCPYVQRVDIVLREKAADFERRDIDLAHKPDWFLHWSPLGKTPVLVVDGQPVFESAVICDYLDETLLPRLHPENALRRAQHRAWVAYASTALDLVGRLYSAADDEQLAQAAEQIERHLVRLEQVLPQGPFFSGEAFSQVDAAFAPVFRYFDVIDPVAPVVAWAALPRVSAWRDALRQRPSVVHAAPQDYAQRLSRFLLQRGSALSRRMEANIGAMHTAGA